MSRSGRSGRLDDCTLGGRLDDLVFRFATSKNKEEGKIKREEEEREQEECKEEGKNKTVKLESLKLKFHVDSHHLQIET